MAQKILHLGNVPAKATCHNIKTILDTMDVYDRRADRAHQRGDFSRATEYSNFCMELDALISNYRGALPEGN